MGRPTKYTFEIAQQICERIAAGEYVTAICGSEFMPHRDTVYSWLHKHPEFADIYARAREAWADAQLEEILNIAHDGVNDTYLDKDGHEQVRHDVIARSRLRVDTLKWALAKVNKKRFGDKTEVDVTNSDGSLAVAKDPKDVMARLEAIYQKALAAPVVTDAEFQEVEDIQGHDPEPYPDDGSDLC